MSRKTMIITWLFSAIFISILMAAIIYARYLGHHQHRNVAMPNAQA
jgi:hypothetical protein